MDKSYNKFERAYEIMTELIKESPLPIDPIERARKKRNT